MQQLAMSQTCRGGLHQKCKFGIATFSYPILAFAVLLRITCLFLSFLELAFSMFMSIFLTPTVHQTICLLSLFHSVGIMLAKTLLQVKVIVIIIAVTETTSGFTTNGSFPPEPMVKHFSALPCQKESCDSFLANRQRTHIAFLSLQIIPPHSSVSSFFHLTAGHRGSTGWFQDAGEGRGLAWKDLESLNDFMKLSPISGLHQTMTWRGNKPCYDKLLEL